MAGIKENTSYNDAAQKATSGVINKIYSISKSAKNKRADTSRYGGLANQVSKPTQSFDTSSFSNLGTLTVPYGGSTRYEKFHPALDIANKIGTPIPSYSGGTVTDVVRGQVQGSPGYGNYVIIKDSNGNSYRYSHLSRSLVKVGDSITKGSEIGLMGNTGSTYSLHGGTGSHLDLRIKDIYGKYVNPYSINN